MNAKTIATITVRAKTQRARAFLLTKCVSALRADAFRLERGGVLLVETPQDIPTDLAESIGLHRSELEVDTAGSLEARGSTCPHNV